MSFSIYFICSYSVEDKLIRFTSLSVCVCVCVYRSIFCLSYLEYFSWSPGRWCWYCVCKCRDEINSEVKWMRRDEKLFFFCARLHLGSAMHIRTLMDSLQYAENDFDCRNIWLTPVWNSWLILSWLLHYSYRTFYFIVATAKQHQYHKGTLEHMQENMHFAHVKNAIWSVSCDETICDSHFEWLNWIEWAFDVLQSSEHRCIDIAHCVHSKGHPWIRSKTYERG